SSTIAVEDSDKLAPSTIASGGFFPAITAAPAITALVRRTCEPPRPTTRRRIADSLGNDSSRPTRKSRNTIPNWAMPATFWASLIVNHDNPGNALLIEPSPNGPKTAPAPRYPRTELNPHRRTTGTTTPAVPRTTRALLYAATWVGVTTKSSGSTSAQRLL